jgi:hypothetical protein
MAGSSGAAGETVLSWRAAGTRPIEEKIPTMTRSELPAERQRRIGAYVALGVGLFNLVLGVVVGATITIAVAVFLLIVGGALLISSLGLGGRPPPT